MGISGRTQRWRSRHLALPRRLTSRLLVLPSLVLLVAGWAAGAQKLKPFSFALPRMGTEFRLTLYASSQLVASQAAMAAFERVEQLENILSAFREQSELVRVSREATGGPVRVSQELFDLLERALRISELSAGAFDITVGPVVDLWREAWHRKHLPDQAALAAARSKVGYQSVELDPGTRTVHLRRAGMKLDLGGIAAGYAADQALTVLRSRGVQSALVDAGGDIVLGAAPPGRRGWKIAVHDPGLQEPMRPCTLLLDDVAIATSADTYQYVELGDHRYSHVVDPITGIGLERSGSTTVVAPKGAMADALATALSVMGVAEGLRLARSIPGVSTYMVRRKGEQWERFASGRFEQECAQLLNGSP